MRTNRKKHKTVRRKAAKSPPSKTQKSNGLASALRESEARFRDLVELASDWYWEQSEDFRFTVCVGEALGKAGFRLDEGIGKARWGLPYIGVTEGQWAEHKATNSETCSCRRAMTRSSSALASGRRPSRM